MKKLFGLLVIGSVGMFIACTSDDSDSNPYNVSESCPAGTVSMIDAAGNSYCGQAAVATSSSANGPTPVAVSSSAYGPTPVAVSSSATVQPITVSSSSVAATPVVASSSSVAQTPVAKSSSSKKTTVTPVTEDEDDGTFKLGLWDGTAGAGQVPTGNKQGGYWYSYTDVDNGGESSVTWCSDAGSEYGADDLAPVIKDNGGLCGTIELLVGTNEYKPYVGIGFNYGKTGTLTADATASKGVCIAYDSDIPMKLVLGMGTTMDNKLGGGNPYVDLKAGRNQSAEFTWAEFDQPEWATVSATGRTAAASLGSITIKFEGDTDGKDGKGGSFLIKKLGAIGACD